MAAQDAPRPPLPMDSLECRQAAEDAGRHDTERLVYALLACAAELRAIRGLLQKR